MALRSLAPLTLLAVLVAGCNAVLGYESATLAQGATGGDSGVADPNSCSAYCTKIMAACTGVNAEYINADVCLSMCSHFDPGAVNEESGNSLACRIWHTTAAKSDPTTHCRHAGPLGGGVCGANPCSEYCTLDVALCSTQSAPPYTGESECGTACPTFLYEQAATSSDLISSGDTLNCRLYHLESAYVGTTVALTTHCPHTAVASATCN